MRDASSELVFRSLRILHANGCHYRLSQSLASSVQLRRYANHRAEDSSTSNLGTGEPPIDENQTQRGVSGGETSGMKQNTSIAGTGEVGRHDETTSTSKLDSGASPPPAAAAGTPRAGEKKKSRTGSDMSDDGQVHTPHLGRTRTTRDMIQDKGRETEERLARTGSKST